jgi:hypothetical protein
MDHDQNLVFTLLLIVELEILVLFWVIFYTLSHQTSGPTWEELVILDQIYKIWISPSVSDVVVIASSANLLFAVDQYCLSL